MARGAERKTRSGTCLAIVFNIQAAKNQDQPVIEESVEDVARRDRDELIGLPGRVTPGRSCLQITA